MQKLSEKKKEIVEEMMKEAFQHATCTVLEECGWPGLTMERVAEKAGVSKGTVYNYFKDKRELVWCVMEKLISDLEKRTGEIFRRNESCADALRELIREEMLSRKKNANIMTAFLHAFHEEPELRKRMFDKRHPFLSLQAMIEDLLERGMEKGEFRSMDPVAMRSILNAILMGVSRQWAGGHLTLAPDVMSDSIISLLTDGLIIKGDDRP
ncbi:MAG: TetR/AcrR family transcriptional regulator [Synergistales bacterium]|nr:TetR/AcrR family transcriptional regulator [Synergistales bacterium]